MHREAELTPPIATHGDLSHRFRAVRSTSLALCDSLSPEDCQIQSMPDASPAKWHLAHTSWFFETFVLEPYVEGHRPHHETYGYLFHSYHNGAGERHGRPDRGLLTRPNLGEVLEYRAAVDDAMQELLANEDHPKWNEVLRVVETGLHHEQQHQELILTDLKHLFAQNVLRPAYRETLAGREEPTTSLSWVAQEEGVYEIGHVGNGFCFDNETPRHRVFVEAFALADRLVTNGEWLEFVEDDGYARSDLWLDRGWATVQREGWQHPLYWQHGQRGWSEFTLAGERELWEAEPVCHVSFIEADAFARWAGYRLPSEAEWQMAATWRICTEANVLRRYPWGDALDTTRCNIWSSGIGQTVAVHAHADGAAPNNVLQLVGNVWEWTASKYYGGDSRVVRGGSWLNAPKDARVSNRGSYAPGDQSDDIGFRCAQ